VTISRYMLLSRKNVGDYIIGCWSSEHSLRSVPTLADIHLRLSETEIQQGNLSGAVSTLTEGLAIERSQYVIYSLY